MTLVERFSEVGGLVGDTRGGEGELEPQLEGGPSSFGVPLKFSIVGEEVRADLYLSRMN